MNNHDKNKESSYLEYLDANNLYGWAMSQKLPVRNFKWIEKGDISKFNEDFVKNYDENSDKGYIFENYIIHIRALKQAINHGLKLEKVHKVIEFDQEAWLKPYIDMNTDLRKQVKNDFGKDFNLINNSVFGKTMENVRNHRDIKIVTMDKRRSILASEPNYLLTKYISRDLLLMEMKKTEVKMNKPIYLGQAILGLSKTLECMNFGMITLSLSIVIKQDYVIWILTALLLILKLKIFTKTLLVMLKDDLIHRIMIKTITDLFQ